MFGAASIVPPNCIFLNRMMSMKHHIERYNAGVHHCNDGNGVSIRLTEQETRFLEESSLFTIDTSDSFLSAVQSTSISQKGGRFKKDIIERAYRVALTRRLIQNNSLSVVHTRDIDRALRMGGYDLEKSYDFAVNKIYTKLKVVMDQHRYNKACVLEHQQCTKKMQSSIQAKSMMATKDRRLLQEERRELEAMKKELALVLKCYNDYLPHVTIVLREHLDKMEKELKARGKMGIKRGQLHKCLKHRFYDYDKAVCLAMQEK